MPNQFMPNPLRDKVLELLHLKVTSRKIAEQLGITRNQVTGIRYRAGGSIKFGQEDKRRGERRAGLDAPVLGGAKALGKVQKGECLYPHGTPGAPGFRFCRHPRQSGSPYCPKHHKACYMGFKASKDAGRPLRREWNS